MNGKNFGYQVNQYKVLYLSHNGDKWQQLSLMSTDYGPGTVLIVYLHMLSLFKLKNSQEPYEVVIISSSIFTFYSWRN